VNPTTVEVFLPATQLELYYESLEPYLLARPTLTRKDFRRRAAAYRQSHFSSYRLATLEGLSHHLQMELLGDVLTETYLDRPPPSKYHNIRAIVEADMTKLQQALQSSSPPPEPQTQ
jgi:hypothetical protein